MTSQNSLHVEARNFEVKKRCNPITSNGKIVDNSDWNHVIKVP